ncbi:glycoside hydrolase [Kockovaella imperatae]|uniref:Glycoside hydrolase n=1 Tax=Kockovaella imperatae TaxID=4999 RepID=A0A1Y1URM0_9TREE|nr:glycoside hydrolase [Kockovaella imperatae]ORX40144.1 glycoside hydrolase [Kockovaella imperatae]
MNVLSSGTEKHGMDLLEAVYEMMIQDGYLRWRGGPVLSTFGGHEARFGDWGWPGFIERLNERLDGKIMFIPAFFMPPKDFLTLPYVDGAFNWNSAWPQGDHSANVVEDEAFCEDPISFQVKPYMAAVSPLFFTHYGSSGEWAFNKNFIYRSDDLLYPWRWHALLSLPPNKSPNIIQIISWNDHGESHAIAPVRHNQPGSEEWTKDMPHEAFREMTRYFVRRWRDGLGEVEEFAPQSKGDLESTVKVWGWWRCHSKDLKASDDPVGEPVHADWARDLLNFLIVVPETSSPFHMVVHNGPNPQPHHLESGKANLITIPFVPGLVGFEVMEGSTDVIISASGKEIADQIQKYNFNMWGGSWEVKVGVRPS